MKTKGLALVALVIFALAVTAITAYAASINKTPAEVAAGLTERGLQAVIDERVQEEKGYGVIAREAGKLDEFKAEVLEIKRRKLAERVAKGAMTREEADEILRAIEEKQAHCDGTGTGCRVGCRWHGAGFGSGKRAGRMDRPGHGCREW